MQLSVHPSDASTLCPGSKPHRAATVRTRSETPSLAWGWQLSTGLPQGERGQARHGHDLALAAGSGKTAMRGQPVDTFKKLASMTYQNEVYITAWI